MITSTEIQFISDVLSDLAAIADPSEYLENEVEEALLILKSTQRNQNEIDKCFYTKTV